MPFCKCGNFYVDRSQETCEICRLNERIVRMEGEIVHYIGREETLMAHAINTVAGYQWYILTPSQRELVNLLVARGFAFLDDEKYVKRKGENDFQVKPENPKEDSSESKMGRPFDARW